MADTGALPRFEDLATMKAKDIESKYINYEQIDANHYYAKKNWLLPGFTYLGVNSYPTELANKIKCKFYIDSFSDEEQKILCNDVNNKNAQDIKNEQNIANEYYKTNKMLFTDNNNKERFLKTPTRLIEVQPPEQSGGKPRKTIRRKSKKLKMRKTRRKSLTKN